MKTTMYSDALAPTSREVDASFTGEAALIRPASTTVALRVSHASLAGDVAALHSAVTKTQAVMSEDIRCAKKIDDLSNMVQETLVPQTVSSLGTRSMFMYFVSACLHLIKY